MYFYTDVCSQVSNEQQTIAGSDIGLAPNSRPAITCINDGLFYSCMHIYASTNLHELNPLGAKYI